MTLLRYTLQDAYDWADFSGDHNPVHFDMSWVKSHGGNALSVHGMRALLDMKRFISSECDGSPLLKCSVRLRKPLLCDISYQLICYSKNIAAAKVVERMDGPTHFSCQLTAEDSAILSISDGIYTLEGGQLADICKSFAKFMPDIQQWIFLDALLFRHLIQEDTVIHHADIVGHFPNGINLNDLFLHYTVVQTHQETVFDSSLLAPWEWSETYDVLHIETLPAVVVGDLQRNGVIRIAAKTHFKNSTITSAFTLKVGAID